ncbi:MAG: outer membrane beta-barrel protein [Gemmatimonadales bacterium]
MCATAAAGQVCQGELSFRRAGSTHVNAALASGNNVTSYGAGLSRGHAQGWYSGASVGLVDYSGVNSNGVAINGGLGYSMPLQAKSRWQVCPNGNLTLGFGPSFDTGAGTMRLSTQTITMGASFGTPVPLSKTVTLLPFASASFGHTRAAAKLNGVSTSGSDNYLLIGGGAGFQLMPSLVIRPALTLAAGADLVDDTVFSLGVTFGLGH